MSYLWKVGLRLRWFSVRKVCCPLNINFCDKEGRWTMDVVQCKGPDFLIESTICSSTTNILIYKHVRKCVVCDYECIIFFFILFYCSLSYILHNTLMPFQFSFLVFLFIFFFYLHVLLYIATVSATIVRYNKNNNNVKNRRNNEIRWNIILWGVKREIHFEFVFFFLFR